MKLQANNVNIIIGDGSQDHGEFLAAGLLSSVTKNRNRITILTCAQDPGSFEKCMRRNGLTATVVDASEWFARWIDKIEDAAEQCDFLVIDTVESVASNLYSIASVISVSRDIAEREGTTIVFLHYPEIQFGLLEFPDTIGVFELPGMFGLPVDTDEMKYERLVKYLADYGYSDIQNSRDLVEVYGLQPRES